MARVTVTRVVSADTETPVSAYLKIRKPPYGFLFESVEGGERIGRYSVLGSGPTALFTARGRVLEERRDGRITRTAGDPLALLARRFGTVPRAPEHGRPPFEGGLVGWVGYDAVRHVEHLPTPPRDDLGLSDIFMMLQESALVFDHVRHTITIVAHAEGGGAAARARAHAAADDLERRLARPLARPPEVRVGGARLPRLTSNMTRGRFLANVVKAKRFIRVGDIIQVVLSQRFSAPFTGDPVSVYRAQRALNPSPYMFLLEGGEATLVGASPEMLVRVMGDTVMTRPIAGSRPRGRTPAVDGALERELRADPKERAEHVMLVDLGRNDLGRVCRYGSVQVEDSMVVERYSHIMHLVSGVRGVLRPKVTAFDVLRATFPAGTVSGAPKVRAMQIIDALEPTRRATYAGIVGYIGYSGNMDTALALRTILLKDGRAHVQAGMGIVADSVPAREFEESQNKARASLLAIGAATGGDR